MQQLPASYVLHILVYPCQSYSFVSFPPLPWLCPQVCSPHLCLYSCPANRFISTIFLDSTDMCWQTIFFSLSDLLHPVCQAHVPIFLLTFTWSSQATMRQAWPASPFLESRQMNLRGSIPPKVIQIQGRSWAQCRPVSQLRQGSLLAS